MKLEEDIEYIEWRLKRGPRSTCRNRWSVCELLQKSADHNYKLCYCELKDTIIAYPRHGECKMSDFVSLALRAGIGDYRFIKRLLETV